MAAAQGWWSALQALMADLRRRVLSSHKASLAVNAEVQEIPWVASMAEARSRQQRWHCWEMARTPEAAKTASGQGLAENATC